MADIDKIKEQYQNAYKDIIQGLNLEKWQSDVDAAIVEINIYIENHKTQFKDEPTALLTIKNELYRLKYLILEQI